MAATSTLLGELHELVATALLVRIKSGEATAAEFAQAIKLLRTTTSPLSQPQTTGWDSL